MSQLDLIEIDPIRISCLGCGAEEDCTKTLKQLKRAGWHYIHQIQSYKESTTIQLSGHPMAQEWETHQGFCKKCDGY